MLNLSNKKYVIGIVLVAVVIAAILLVALLQNGIVGNVINPVGSDDAVTIGALLPLSGKNAVYGKEMQNAIELAREEINAKGGINSRMLEIIYEDDQANPAVGVKGMQKLVSVDNVNVVLGPWASGVVVAAAPIAEENKVIMMASAIAPAITNAGDHVFRIQPSANLYTEKAASFLVKAGMKKAAVLYINNEFGVSIKNTFLDDFQAAGGKVVITETYAEGDTDFRSELEKIRQQKPEVIFIAGYQDTINVVKQMKELGINAMMLAGPPFESQSTIDALGEDAEGIIYPYHFVAGNENTKAQQYEKNYLQRYGVQTGGYAPLMYDATYIIAECMKRCGGDTDCIKVMLYEMKYDGAVGKITFDENGDSSVPIVMKTVKDGRFVEVKG